MVLSSTQNTPLNLHASLKRLLEHSMHKDSLHVELLLSVEQVGACIFALLCDKAHGFSLYLKVLYSEEVTGGAIKSSVQLVSQLLLWRQSEMRQVVQTMISDQQQAARPQSLQQDNHKIMRYFNSASVDWSGVLEFRCFGRLIHKLISKKQVPRKPSYGDAYYSRGIVTRQAHLESRLQHGWHL